jgi:aspartyl protease family protein
MFGWLILALAALIGAFIYMRGGAPDIMGGFSATELAVLAGGGLLVLTYLVSLASEERSRPLQALRNLAVWIGIGAVLIAGYAYREELTEIGQRMVAELAPPGEALIAEPSTAGETAVRIRRRSDGHFTARGEVNGVPIALLVDTGASTVVLKSADAERVGIDTSSLAFTAPVDTANGTTYAARVRLRSIGIGPITVQGIDALVAKPGSVNESLLGMTFLRRLRSYEFAGDFLTLRN